ncbi:tol-pal system-associated acyl-CoA thioesterase [Tepidicaulis sp.]|uniref:tol-pal system-associated acyl-CoA thioesterase n=1 Tax=Tepidicaulis sp. TaxID=1920809 RepID=UPI003B58DE9E
MSGKWPDLAGRIEEGAHVLPIRVYYEDTDFTGIVYHANYLRFAERGRSDCLRMAGVHHHELIEGEKPLAFAIHKMEIEFLKPARIDDLLEVHTRYVTLKGARIEAEQKILRGGEVIWQAMVHAACIHEDGRPARLPKTVIDGVEDLMKRGG